MLLKEVWNLFKGNWKTSFLFELIYKAILVTVILPLMGGLLTLAMHAKGYTYLSGTNLVGLLTSPVTWVLILVMLFLFAFYSLFEICALVILAHASKDDQRLRLRDVARLSAMRAKKVFGRHNISTIVYVLLLIPFTNIGLASSAVTSIHVPEFIADFISANTFLATLVLIAVIALAILAFLLLFSMQYFSLEDITFSESTKRSKRLIKGGIWYVLWRLALLSICISLAGFVVALLASLVTFVPMSNGLNSHTMMLASVIWTSLISFLIACFTTPLAYCSINALFYRSLGRQGEALPPDVEMPSNDKGAREMALTALGAFVVAAIALTLGTQNMKADLDCMAKALTEGPSTCEVTAHCGGALAAPENTLEAFQHSIDIGADWVELDVQQTRDGVLVIMHDSNLKRTTGVDKNIWDVDYDEIKDLDNGSYFSSDFSGARICTFEQALELCKGKIKMNIEVKPDGHGTDLEKKTVDMINQCGMADQVAVASIKYDSLVKVKEYDPSITTMYDMTLAYGNIADIDDVDIYSVDEAFITPSLTFAVNHYQGEVESDDSSPQKKIFAWTVNQEDNMRKMYFYGVDSLVTDNIQQAEAICR